MNLRQAPRTLNKNATTIIRSVYAETVDPQNPSRPRLDPHLTLTDIARSVAIVGDLLGQLSDQYFKAGKKYASMLATAGQVFWGIVEVSVPNSLGFRLMSHWLKLFTAFSVLMILFGTIFSVGAMASFGWKLLAVILVVAILRSILHGFILTAAWPVKLIVAVIVVIVSCILIWLAVAYGDPMARGLHWLAHLGVHLRAGLIQAETWLKGGHCKC
jgi:hypothetical protein